MSEIQATPRQKQILAALLAVAALMFIWQVAAPAFMGWINEGAAARKADRSAERTASITQRPVERVRMEDLQREGATYRPKRNIFRYAPPKPVAPPPRVVPPPRVAPPPPPPPQPPPPPTGPVPPPVNFTLLGLFGPEDGRIAVLVDGEEIINARLDDVVKDEYVIADIGFEVVDIGFVNFPETSPVRLEIEGKAARKGGGGGNARGGRGNRGARERGRRGR
ncbi:MAG: hypothetical protein AAFY88_01195 [Acidobacteriota bacterium]